jgi:glycosyltransferase involved in cell wall biosynthesis
MAEPGIVSVIIPVYNAASYITQAVESAVHLDAVGEVILVEDGSPDNALEICQGLEKKYDKVKLFQHPYGENRGAGASRNLGIQKASCEWIAFLDADDWYLPNRFDDLQKALSEGKEFDGIYGASVIYDQGLGQKTRIKRILKKIQPDDLFEGLVMHRNGRFDTDSIVAKKSKLIEVGLFNESLRLHQDTELWYRLAFNGKLIAEDLTTPLAVVRRHGNNRITNLSGIDTKEKFNTVVYQYFKDKKVSPQIFRILFNRFLYSHVLTRKSNRVINLLSGFYIFTSEILLSPKRLVMYLRGSFSK